MKYVESVSTVIRLGLSASEAVLLLGVSNQSVYKRENGMTRPRASQFASIAALRNLSQKQAAARLGELTAQGLGWAHCRAASLVNQVLFRFNLASTQRYRPFDGRPHLLTAGNSPP